MTNIFRVENSLKTNFLCCFATLKKTKIDLFILTRDMSQFHCKYPCAYVRVHVALKFPHVQCWLVSFKKSNFWKFCWCHTILLIFFWKLSHFSAMPKVKKTKKKHHFHFETCYSSHTNLSSHLSSHFLFLKVNFQFKHFRLVNYIPFCVYVASIITKRRFSQVGHLHS